MMKSSNYWNFLLLDIPKVLKSVKSHLREAKMSQFGKFANTRRKIKINVDKTKAMLFYGIHTYTKIKHKFKIYKNEIPLSIVNILVLSQIIISHLDNTPLSRGTNSKQNYALSQFGIVVQISKNKQITFNTFIRPQLFAAAMWSDVSEQIWIGSFNPKRRPFKLKMCLIKTEINRFIKQSILRDFRTSF